MRNPIPDIIITLFILTLVYVAVHQWTEVMV